MRIENKASMVCVKYRRGVLAKASLIGRVFKNHLIVKYCI